MDDTYDFTLYIKHNSLDDIRQLISEKLDAEITADDQNNLEFQFSNDEIGYLEGLAFTTDGGSGEDIILTPYYFSGDLLSWVDSIWSVFTKNTQYDLRLEQTVPPVIRYRIDGVALEETAAA